MAVKKTVGRDEGAFVHDSSLAWGSDRANERPSRRRRSMALLREQMGRECRARSQAKRVEGGPDSHDAMTFSV